MPVINSLPESFISPGSEYGLLRSATPERSVWLFASIPWSDSLLDGADNQARTTAQRQFQSFFQGLADEVPPAAVRRRDMLRRYYREFHLLTSSMSIRYTPPISERNTDIGDWHSEEYRGINTRTQFAVVGVKLQAGGHKKHDRHRTFLQRVNDGLDSLAFSFANGYQQFDDYLDDMETIEGIMLNAGLNPFSRMEKQEREQLVNAMESWWISRPTSSGLPVIAEYDHLHFFPNEHLCNEAKKLYDRGVDCDDWHIGGEYPATMCTLKATSFDHTPIENPSSLWIARMMASARGGGASAVALSIRGTVEPAAVTASEIRRNKRTIDESVTEREEKGRDAPGGMIDALDKLYEGNDTYRQQSVPPTITDTSVMACVAGKADVATKNLKNIPYVEFVSMNSANQQLLAFKNMQACSDVRLVPYERHLTSTVISGGGVSSLATVGDDDGALVGFTEANRQPVYVGTSVASEKDKRPAMLIVGDTGSGKSMLLVKLFIEWSMIDTRDGHKTPCILFNPKEGNDFEDATRAVDGDIIRLDSDVANGTFDPFNVMRDPNQAADTATKMIADILQMTGNSTDDELAVGAMLNYGRRHGAKVCGTMVAKAAQDYTLMLKEGRNPADQGEDSLPPNTLDMADKIRMALRQSQFLRLIFGTNENVRPLSVSEGLTLVNAGGRNIVPDSNARDSMTGRIQQWAMFMIVSGAFSAVEGRYGVVGVDEAWSILDPKSPTCPLIDQKLRLSRSMKVTPVFASQKVREFIDAGMVGGFSRAFLLAMSDNGDEETSPARLALRLLDIHDEQGVMLQRMRADAEKKNGQPNWNSLKALHRQGTRDTIRGSVAYFLDGEKKPTPTEIVIPDNLLAAISTNAIDREARERAKQQHDSSGKD